jgi:hypothetical protein
MEKPNYVLFYVTPIPAWCWHITSPLNLPPDTLHHLYNRYSVRCTCQEQFLLTECRGEQQCQAVDTCTIWFFKDAWQWSYHLLTTTCILGTVHCVKYMALSVKRPGHNWQVQSPYFTVLTSICPRKETPRLGKVLALFSGFVWSVGLMKGICCTART